MKQPRVERAIYVPKGRREINERKMTQAQNIIKEPVDVKIEKEESNNANKNEYSYVPVVEDDQFFFDSVSDDRLLVCCLLIMGFPTDTSDIMKQQLIDSYVTNYGAVSKWCSLSECLLIFRNESNAASALITLKNTSISNAFRLADIHQNLEEYLQSSNNIFLCYLYLYLN